MIDSHCHLAGEEFDPDLPDVVQRARDAGLTSALVILSSGDAAEAARATRVSELWPEVRFAIGIHPHQAGQHVGDVDRSLKALDEELSARGALALGEIGLDYHYRFSPPEVQQELFRRQLRLARERSLPVVIHTREAEDDTFRILAEDGGGLRTVFHCFTGTRAMADKAMELDAWLSFSGIVTFSSAGEIRDVARTVPMDRFLVETDSPYLAPVPHRKLKRNEPALVTRVAEAVAEVRGEPPAAVAVQVVRNFEAAFGRR
jgi:TatD DNase family protein